MSGNEIENLLNDLCRDWGFCLPSEKRKKIASRTDWQPGEFAVEVMRSEGFSFPETETKWLYRLAALFQERSSKLAGKTRPDAHPTTSG